MSIKMKWRTLKNKYLLIVVLFVSTFATPAFSQVNSQNIIENAAQINRYFELPTPDLPEKEVIYLAMEITKDRHLYQADVVAKTFILLAETAINKGDMTKATQFAKDGLSINGIDQSLELNLRLKVIAGAYIKGQFKHIAGMTENAVSLSQQIGDQHQLIISLAYRAMISALLEQDVVAYQDLQRVREIMDNNPSYAQHIDMLEIFAQAHYFLMDYETATTLFHQVLNLRFEQQQFLGLGLTYIRLANTYLKQNALDDAFNAFWEAKQHAEKVDKPLLLAHSFSGLGESLRLQSSFEKSRGYLLQAEALLKGFNLSNAYLNTLISLAKVSGELGNTLEQYHYIARAVSLAETTDLTIEQYELYALAGKMYYQQGDLESAYRTLAYYSEKALPTLANKTTAVTKEPQKTSALNRQLTLDFAKESELRSQFNSRYDQQQRIMAIQTIIVVVLLSLLIFIYMRLRAQRLDDAIREVEQPIDILATPSQTKKLYQSNFKMARKYSYPLAVGYLSIDNWKELCFHFNKKTINEVSKTLAILINEQIAEFEHAGLINEGEYLLLAPHQHHQLIEAKLKLLSKSVKARFFANLGEFSIKISYACGSPNVQDIDPYIFLSRLSEQTNKYQDKI